MTSLQLGALHLPRPMHYNTVLVGRKATFYGEALKIWLAMGTVAGTEAGTEATRTGHRPGIVY